MDIRLKLDHYRRQEYSATGQAKDNTSGLFRDHSSFVMIGRAKRQLVSLDFCGQLVFEMRREA